MRTREDILWGIEYHTKKAEYRTKWAEKWTKKANKAKQELKAFDEANK